MEYSTPLLQCNHLTKHYKDFSALEDVNLELEKGQIIGLLGPNGSGKTTLIKLLNGLLTPTSGSLHINGLQPSPQTKRIVSYLPDRTYLNMNQTAEQMMEFFMDFYDDFDKERANKMFQELKIDTKKPLKKFSKGMKEKVQLILVMSRNAELYILDEPIGGVDPASRDYIISTIISNYNPEASVLISTHIITDIENILDRVIFLKNGHVILNSTVDDIRMEKKQSINDLFKEVFKC